METVQTPSKVECFCAETSRRPTQHFSSLQRKEEFLTSLGESKDLDPLKGTFSQVVEFLPHLLNDKLSFKILYMTQVCNDFFVPASCWGCTKGDGASSGPKTVVCLPFVSPLYWEIGNSSYLEFIWSGIDVWAKICQLELNTNDFAILDIFGLFWTGCEGAWCHKCFSSTALKLCGFTFLLRLYLKLVVPHIFGVHWLFRKCIKISKPRISFWFCRKGLKVSVGEIYLWMFPLQ